ncbi:Uncharacterised protein [Mycobacteroides abscessus subsp. abscessus]|nr:Uncharacterised protein [Mycobacteroides abscessus subsp. abscessus]
MTRDEIAASASQFAVDAAAHFEVVQFALFSGLPLDAFHHIRGFDDGRVEAD